jgi:mRNA-degrading endonuclease RelE of RelBE toxin-antitoxin system
MSSDDEVNVRFTEPFKRNLKQLAKRYRQIQREAKLPLLNLMGFVVLLHQTHLSGLQNI